MSSIENANAVMSHSMVELTGVNQGNQLRILAHKLKYKLNNGFNDELILSQEVNTPFIDGNLSLTILGPSRCNLIELQKEWNEWLHRLENEAVFGDPQVLANTDRSKPNLSSIMFVAELNDKRILFTGDGRSDHIYDGLKYKGFLSNERCHLDIIKMPHHGSKRNMTRDFLEKITGDIYIFSANGKHDNPDFETLMWIVEVSKQQNRDIEIILTNKTPSVNSLLENYPIEDFSYTLTILEKNSSYLDIAL